MKRRLKFVADVLLLLLFLHLMNYSAGRGLFSHALAGMAFAVLLIVHQLLNAGWYRGLFRGRYAPRRTVLLTIDVLLIAAVLAMLASAAMISGLVFAFSDIPAKFGWIRLHHVSTAWGFLLMAVHLGLHVHPTLKKWEMSLQARHVPARAFQVAVFAAGLCGFGLSGLPDSLMLVIRRGASVDPALGYAFFSGTIAACCLAVRGIFIVTDRRAKIDTAAPLRKH